MAKSAVKGKRNHLNPAVERHPPEPAARVSSRPVVVCLAVILDVTLTSTSTGHSFSFPIIEWDYTTGEPRLRTAGPAEQFLVEASWLSEIKSEVVNLVRTDSEIIDAVRKVVGERDPQCVAFLVQRGEIPLGGLQPVSEARKWTRDVLLQVLRQKQSPPASAEMESPQGTVFFTVALCADPERVEDLWCRVAAGEPPLSAVASVQASTPRKVRGSLDARTGADLLHQKFENRATTLIAEAVREFVKARRRRIERGSRVEFRGHVAYAGLEVPDGLAADLKTAVASSLRNTRADNSSASSGRDWTIEFRLAPPIRLRGAAVDGMDSWLADYRLPVTKEDDGHGVVQDREETSEILERVSAFGASLPPSFSGRRQAMHALSLGVRREIAKAIQESLTTHLATMPQESYGEKKSLAKWVNAELRALGLAIRDPKTGRPCLLVGDPGNRPEQGRFLLDYVDESGSRVHAMTSVALPPLVLMPDDLSRAPYGSRVSRSR